MRYRNPDNSGRSRNTVVAAPPTRRETFLDDMNAFDHTGTDDSSDDRDMHDLSLSPKHITRASVVDNMLLSFDQFSTPGPSLLDDPHLLPRATDAGDEYDDDDDEYQDEDDEDDDEDGEDDVYRRPNRYLSNSRYSSTKLGRPRGHTFSSSLSSDVDIPTEDNQGRYSAISSRGRRSNSSSNQFQPGLRRIESVTDCRGPDADPPTERGRVSDYQRAMHPSEKSQNNNRGRRVPNASRSAVTSGVDFPHPVASGRHGPYSNGYNARRSTSLDGVSRQRQQFSIPVPDYEDAYGTATSGTESPHYGHTIFDIDAAPTPTVPAGPRRERSPTRRWHESSGSQYPASSPNTPALSRKNSTKSSKSAYKKGRADTLGTSTIRGRNGVDDDFIQFRDSLREAPPPMPGTINPSAPSPTVSYRKPSIPQIESTPTPTKERPGFFRRVFGGSSKNSSPNQPERHPAQQQHPQDQVRAGVSTAKSEATTGSTTADNNTVSRENTPIVTKKPSSFFRRRKKSFVDHNPPPPLVLPQKANLKPLDQFKNPEPSPVSSLRKIMTPYLANPNSTTSVPADAAGLKPRPETGREAPTRGWPHTEDHDTKPMRRPAAPFMSEGAQHKNSSKYSLSLEPPTREHDSSFLADSSGNEGPSSRSSLKQGANGQGGSSDKNKRPKTSPVATNRAEKAPVEEPRDFFANAKMAADIDETSSRIAQSEGIQFKHPAPPNPSLTVPEPSRADWESKENLSLRNKAAREGRGWLDGASSEENIDESSKISLPIEGAGNSSPRESTSDVSHYQTAENTPNIPSNATPDWNKQALAGSGENAENSHSLEPGPSPAEMEQAQKIYDNQDGPESDDSAAAWLGSPDREMVRKAYMELFNWSNMNILVAMRSLCSRIALKGETQQVDRILDSFSSQWCRCNPKHGFKATGKLNILDHSWHHHVH